MICPASRLSSQATRDVLTGRLVHLPTRSLAVVCFLQDRQSHPPHCIAARIPLTEIQGESHPAAIHEIPLRGRRKWFVHCPSTRCFYFEMLYLMCNCLDTHRTSTSSWLTLWARFFPMMRSHTYGFNPWRIWKIPPELFLTHPLPSAIAC